MRITLVSATHMEIKDTIERIPAWNQLNNIAFDHLITGVGLVATTYSLAKFLQNNRPDLMIQAGIAGCFDKKIPLGSTFFVKNELIGDLGVLENSAWKDAFDLGLINENQHPWQHQRLTNNLNSIPEFTNIQTVDGISVNEITTDPAFMETMMNRYNAKVESMEGAAFHYTCLQENISFIQLRTTSNYVGERNKQKWLLKESIGNLNTVLINYINHIINSRS